MGSNLREKALQNKIDIPHTLNNIQVLISGGIGCGLRLRLEEEGIDSIITSESEPDLAVITYLESFLVNKLSQLHQRKRRRDRPQDLHEHAYHLPTINLSETV